MVFKFKLLNSFLFRINNSLPCQDLNPGPPGEKQMTYQCATVLLCHDAVIIKKTHIVFTSCVKRIPRSKIKENLILNLVTKTVLFCCIKTEVKTILNTGEVSFP